MPLHYQVSLLLPQPHLVSPQLAVLFPIFSTALVQAKPLQFPGGCGKWPYQSPHWVPCLPFHLCCLVPFRTARWVTSQCSKLPLSHVLPRPCPRRTSAHLSELSTCSWPRCCDRSSASILYVGWAGLPKSNAHLPQCPQPQVHSLEVCPSG